MPTADDARRYGHFLNQKRRERFPRTSESICQIASPFSPDITRSHIHLASTSTTSTLPSACGLTPRSGSYYHCNGLHADSCKTSHTHKISWINAQQSCIIEFEFNQSFGSAPSHSSCLRRQHGCREIRRIRRTCPCGCRSIKAWRIRQLY